MARSSHKSHRTDSEKSHRDKKRRRKDDGTLNVMDDEDDAGVWVEKDLDDVRLLFPFLLKRINRPDVLENLIGCHTHDPHVRFPLSHIPCFPNHLGPSTPIHLCPRLVDARSCLWL